MLHSVTNLKRFAIRATDGDIGRVHDVLFDDEHWTVRYLVVDTGTWLPGRQVLISPFAIGRLIEKDEVLTVAATRAQIEHSPDIDTHQPISRQYEAAYARYYGYPFYWGGTGVWGMKRYPAQGHVPTPPPDHSRPGPFIKSEQPALDTLAELNPGDVHLRSCNAAAGYVLHATDGEIGHVDDFLVEDGTWTIAHLIVATSNWWFGHKVMIAPRWIDTISWVDSRAVVRATRDAIRRAPRYDPDALAAPDHDTRHPEHTGQPMA